MDTLNQPLDPKNPALQLWCTWKNELCIQDAVSLQDYPPFEAGSNTGNGKGKGKVRAYLTYPVTLLWYPRMEKTSPKSYGGYAWAEESLLPGGISPVITAYDDDDDDDPVSANELFARANPIPTVITTAAAGTHKRQISEAMSRDERLNRSETTTAAPPQQQQAQAQLIIPGRVAGPGSPNGVIEVQLQSNYSANGA